MNSLSTELPFLGRLVGEREVTVEHIYEKQEDQLLLTPASVTLKVHTRENRAALGVFFKRSVCEVPFNLTAFPGSSSRGKGSYLRAQSMRNRKTSSCRRLPLSPSRCTREKIGQLTFFV